MLAAIVACDPPPPPNMPSASASPAATDPREVRCRAGNAGPNDCFAAANAYDRGSEGHPPRRNLAIELFALGCKAHADDPSCVALKNEIVSLQLTAPHRKEALVLLQAACAAGNADLCNDLATSYVDGIGTPPEPLKALDLFDHTCALAADEEVSMTGCRGVVALVRSGVVEPTDSRAARADERLKALGRRLGY